MVGVRLPDGRKLLVGRNIDDVLEMHARVERVLILALLPAILVCVLGGAVAGIRAQRRLTGLRRAAERIMSGHVVERLPISRRGDDLDQLARIVNRMLDEIERLLLDIKGVSEDIAHDLRTPLTRVRAQLERGREHARTREELAEVVGRAIGGVDQAITTILALLRIAEIEHGRRQSGFGSVELDEIVREVGELYEPIAEDKGLTLAVGATDRTVVHGDRDLLLEALVNLVDNAVKFTPPGGHVAIELAHTPRGATVRVVDTGSGIADSEKNMVFRRFYRSDKSRHTEGVGLGLNLVAAVAKLHGFRLGIASRSPGCVVELACWSEAVS
jgi:signal transduction histidine kinase